MTTTPDTERRDRIAEALLDHLARTADSRPARDGQQAFMPEITDTELHRIADAVAATDQGHTAEVRAAALEEAADFFESTSRIRTQFFGHQVGPILRGMAAAARPDNTGGA